MQNQMTPAVQREQNRIEAMDPYVGLLLVGALAGLVTIASTRAISTRTTSSLIATPADLHTSRTRIRPIQDERSFLT
jgi:hypothetical protein